MYRVIFLDEENLLCNILVSHPLPRQRLLVHLFGVRLRPYTPPPVSTSLLLFTAVVAET